jgi:hypothetical protein
MQLLLRYFVKRDTLCAAGMVLATCSALACPQQPPEGMQAVAVGEQVVVDGLPLAMLQLQGRKSAATVLGQVEKDWTSAGFDVRRNQVSGWSVLSALSDKCMTTLQLSDRGGAFGYMAVSQPVKARAVRPVRLPMPSGAIVLSTVVSDDDGRKGVLATITTPQTPERLYAFYLHQLNDDKWGAVSAHVSMDRNQAAHGALVTAQRGRERIEIVIWCDGQTYALVNLASAL